jgi:kynurenine formamidase
MTLPSYDELPMTDSGGRTAWHLFGEGDSVGMVNLQTPERVLAAAGLVRLGKVFSLNVPFDFFTPALATPMRSNARHSVDVVHLPFATGCDDVYDNFYPQAHSQWDSLAHASYGPAQFYNGATEAQVVAGERNTIDHWARRGIAGQGVVLDLAAGGDYDPGSAHALTVEDLEAARVQAGVEIAPGAVLLLHTGYAQWYGEQSSEAKAAIPGNLTAVGLEHSEAMCRYLWDLHPAAIVCDTFAVEVWPPSFDPADAPFGFIHQMLIGGFGIALGELWWLADLAADCRDDGVYECLLVSAPLNLPGGIGSTANALALK